MYEMPPAPDDLQPVPFDFGIASDLISALHTAAQEVSGAARARAGAAEVAVTGWEGSARRNFDRQEQANALDASHLETQLRSMASAVEAAVHKVQAINAHRETELKAWYKTTEATIEKLNRRAQQ